MEGRKGEKESYQMSDYEPNDPQYWTCDVPPAIYKMKKKELKET
jgi:hypothetical protein